MSIPNIPDICPKILLEEEDVYNLTLTSIALEEIALAQIIKAESSKIEHFIEKSKCNASFYEEVLKINESVESVLDKVYAIENLLVNKTKLIATMKSNYEQHGQKKDKVKKKSEYDEEYIYDKEYTKVNKNINDIFSKFK